MRNIEEKWKFAILLAGGAGFHAHRLFIRVSVCFRPQKYYFHHKTRVQIQTRCWLFVLRFRSHVFKFSFFSFFLFLGFFTMVSSQNDPKTNHRNNTSQKEEEEEGTTHHPQGKSTENSSTQKHEGRKQQDPKEGERGGEWRRSPISANLNRSGPCFM